MSGAFRCTPDQTDHLASKSTNGVTFMHPISSTGIDVASNASVVMQSYRSVTVSNTSMRGNPCCASFPPAIDACGKNDHRADACSKNDHRADACSKGIASSIGNAIIGCVSKVNDLLNTPLISSLGQTFNKFGPVGQLIHLVPDLGGYAASKATAGVGEALGGSGSPNYHFEHEWKRAG
jgi:hypothetical protein